MSDDIMTCGAASSGGSTCVRLPGHNGSHYAVDGAMWPGPRSVVKSMTCWQIDCDECGTEFYEESETGTIPHFPSEAEALARIDSCGDDCTSGSLNLHRRGDRVLCTHCAHRADCEERGHRWGEWHAGYRFRTCDHCGWWDSEPSPEAAKGGGDQ